MTGDDTPPRLRREPSAAVTVGDILDLAEWMRGLVSDAKDDLRREIATGHDVLAAKVDVVSSNAREVAAAQRDYAAVHAQEHIREDIDARAWRDKLADVIKTSEIAKARRDGLLGGVRFVFNLIGVNWRGLGIVFAGIGVLVGNIHISFGA